MDDDFIVPLYYIHKRYLALLFFHICHSGKQVSEPSYHRLLNNHHEGCYRTSGQGGCTTARCIVEHGDPNHQKLRQLLHGAVQAATPASVASNLRDASQQLGFHHRSRENGRLGPNLKFPVPGSQSEVDQRSQ